MKKSKSALIIVLFVLLCSVFLFFVPLDSLIQNLPVLKGFYQNTALEISTPNGKATVTINGKDSGETPLSIQKLFSGKYKIGLTRISLEEGVYKTHDFDILLTKNTTALINMEIGPGDNLHGVMIYYTEDKTGEKDKGKITIISNADDTKIYINDEYLKDTPITNMEIDDKEYTIKLKAQNYEDLEFPVIVRSGYVLNIKGYLFPIPITFELESTDE